MIKNNRKNYRKACQHLNVGDLVFIEMITSSGNYDYNSRKLNIVCSYKWEAGILLNKLVNHDMVIFLQESMKEITITDDKPKLILSPRQYRKYFWKEHANENRNEK